MKMQRRRRSSNIEVTRLLESGIGVCEETADAMRGSWLPQGERRFQSRALILSTLTYHISRTYPESEEEHSVVFVQSSILASIPNVQRDMATEQNVAADSMITPWSASLRDFPATMLTGP